MGFYIHKFEAVEIYPFTYSRTMPNIFILKYQIVVPEYLQDQCNFKEYDRKERWWFEDCKGIYTLLKTVRWFVTDIGVAYAVSIRGFCRLWLYFQTIIHEQKK